MSFDLVNLHWLWRETVNSLDAYAKRVRECKDLLGAADFARFVRSSGLLKLFDAHESLGPFEVSGASVRKKVSDLLFECGERMRSNKTEPLIALSELEAINRKLELIAGHVSKLSPVADLPADSRTTEDTGQNVPVLCVIEGGDGCRQDRASGTACPFT